LVNWLIGWLVVVDY